MILSNGVNNTRASARRTCGEKSAQGKPSFILKTCQAECHAEFVWPSVHLNSHGMEMLATLFKKSS